MDWNYAIINNRLGEIYPGPLLCNQKGKNRNVQTGEEMLGKGYQTSKNCLPERKI